MNWERLILDIDEGSQESLGELVRHLERKGIQGHFYRMVRIEFDKGGKTFSSKWKSFTWACQKGHLPLVERYVEEGGNIHLYQEKALRTAAEYQQPEVVKYLIEKGANPKVNNGTPFVRACIDGCLEIVEYMFDLMEPPIQERGLSRACNYGALETVVCLVERKVPFKDHNLEAAAVCGKLEIVRYLLSLGLRPQFYLGRSRTLEIRNLLEASCKKTDFS